MWSMLCCYVRITELCHCHWKWPQFNLYILTEFLNLVTKCFVSLDLCDQSTVSWLAPHIHVCRSGFTTLWHNIRAINVSYVPWAHALSRFIDCCFQKYKTYTALANKTLWHSTRSSEDRPSAALSISRSTEWNWSMTLISNHDRCVCWHKMGRMVRETWHHHHSVCLQQQHFSLLLYQSR